MTLVMMTSVILKDIHRIPRFKMAMPRPSGEALKIAEMVIPGLNPGKSSRRVRKRKKVHGSMSKVEIEQTNNIENKEGLR